MYRINAFDWTTLIISILGALNWGLVGFFGFDLIAAIFGTLTAVSRVLYAIVGLAGLYNAAITLPKLASGATSMTGSNVSDRRARGMGAT